MQKVVGRMTVTDTVTLNIRERILTGDYVPGSKLDQNVLVREFGASIIPVRESLRQLESQGFIRLYPHRGAYVADVSLDELQEIYLMRETLEHMAAQLGVPNLTQTNIGLLSELEADFQQAIDIRDYDRILDLSQQFVFIIYKASNKPLLCQIVKGLMDRSQIYRQLAVHMPDHLQRVTQNFRGILRHIKRKDADAAANAVRQNLHQTVLSFMEHYAGKDMKQSLADGHAKTRGKVTRRARVTSAKP